MKYKPVFEMLHFQKKKLFRLYKFKLIYIMPSAQFNQLNSESKTTNSCNHSYSPQAMTAFVA